MKIKNIEHALEVFEKKTIKHGELTKAGETSKRINYEYNGIVEAVRWLHNKGELIKLSKFYENPYLNVRSWAASFLLEIDNKKAEQVLEELIEKKYFNATYVLMEWKAGTLDMNFYKE